ncbi:porin family protein [Aquimarina gracilis]|uniref:Porin family protein n=1 Tax=Aquimarina gracilis TaxID=874422 RepID=A0ABU5ZVM1_9FLAO|nr:porin family protein [Aquimarina gracilis]MEB3345922.1 porin family protein [Aquimarina gracilis]
MKITIIILFIINTVNLFSQDYDYPLSSSRFGIKAGVNFAGVLSENFENTDFRTGFNIGLTVEGMITEKFGFQIEGFYSQQGFELDQSVGNRLSVKIDYIQLPILAKAYFFKGFNMQAGIQMGFKVHENIDANFADFATEEMYNFDFQLIFGLEYIFKNGFFIQVRYSYGLSEIIDGSEISSSVLSTGVGFMLY